MDAVHAAEAHKPAFASSRPHLLRQRSQSAATKPSNDVDSDASKRSSVRQHRHAHSHHHIPHHPKRFAKDVLGLPNGPFGADLSKQNSRIPPDSGSAAALTQVDSRKGSVGTYGNNNVDGAGASATTGDRLAGLSVEEIGRMVQREEWKNKARQSELQATLHALSEDSMKTTRRLDDLYYNLLEKLSGLHSTINSLRELSSLTARLHTQFKDETGALTTDLQSQIDAFAGFRAQQGKTVALDVRVRESKQKADVLSARLEAARKRVVALEQREREYQDSISWRLRWMWITLGTVAGIILAVCVLPYLGLGMRDAAAIVQRQNHEQATRELESLTAVPAPVKSVLEEVLGTTLNTSVIPTPFASVASSSVRSSTKRTPPTLLEPTSPADWGPLQRLFDEL